LARRNKSSGERTAADREHARLEREARRLGVSVDELMAQESGPPAAAPVPPPLPAEPEPQYVEPPEPFEPESVEPEPPAGAPEPPAAEPEPPAPERPVPAPRQAADWTDPDESFDWEPAGSTPPATPVEPPAADADPDFRDVAPLGHDLPPTELDPPALPARSSARPLPRPPRRRYAQADARRSPAQGPVKKRRSWFARIVALIFLVAVIVALWFLFSLFQPGHGDGHGRVSVTIPQGASAKQIGTLLADKGVVKSGFFFNLRATISGKRGDFKAGSYALAQDMSYRKAMDDLSKTPVAAPTLNITLPEGLSRREIGARVKQAGITGSYLSASDAHAGFSTRRYGAPKGTKTLEGFLFPATYTLKKSAATSTALVGQQLDAFKANIAKVSMTKAKKKNLSTYDVLIIASMVEREAQVAKDRPLIAAVVYNRLKDQMPLGIDATTRYELDQWSSPLRVSQLQKDTPYNTRTRRGLPPTPIGNPGLASIKAAANPASVDYLYYVVKANTCGEHAFSSNNADFQKDVAAYEAARAKNGGKAPTKC
jgi:UPF0755 protein